MKTIYSIFYCSYFWGILFLSVSAVGCQPQSNVGNDCDLTKSDCEPVASPLTKKIKNIDILFVVDTSQSMEQEQNAISSMVNVLITGDRDGDGDPELEPAESLHLAVISTDMGLPGIGPDQNPDSTGACNGVGDDGLLLNEPDTSYDPTTCSGRHFPRFLTYTAGVDDPEQTAEDYACMLNVGIGGCGFEMPLEATLKALWPSSDDSITFLNDATGHGDQENDGFLRDDSLLAIVVVSDEEDCSAGNQGDLDFLSLDFSDGDRRDLNLRCYKDTINEWGNKYPIERYLDGFKALRPNMEDRVIFAVIGGVPPYLVDEESDLPQHLLGYVDKDPEKIEAYYESILNSPDMEEIPNVETNNLTPSCEVVDVSTGRAVTIAFPPRRLVELAKEFGANGVVQSICDLGLDDSLETVTLTITNRMKEVAEKAEAEAKAKE